MKKISQLTFFLIIIISTAYNHPNVYSADAKNTSEIQQLLQSGIDNMKTGNLDAAINNFNKIISLDDKNAHAYVGLGNSYNRKDNPDKAIEYYNKAIALNDKNYAAYVGLGNIYSRKDNPDKAIEYYNKAIALDNKNIAAYVGLGNIYSRKDNPDKAIEYYNKAVAFNDKNSLAYVYAGLGGSYSRKGNYDKAIEYYNKAIAINSSNPVVCYSLGVLYFSVNRKDDALKILKILKGLDKNLADKLERQIQQPKTPTKPDKQGITPIKK